MNKNKEVRNKILRKWGERLKIEDVELLSKFLLNYDNIELVRPLVIQDLKDGVEPGIVQLRYNISQSQLRTIGCRSGLYRPHTRIKRPYHGVVVDW